MMKYKGYYWTVLSPLIRRSIRARYSQQMADTCLQEGKKIYRELLARADDIGDDNPMARNAYFAYVFTAVWLGSRRLISPQGMSWIMEDVLKLLRPLFALVNINRKPRYWEDFMKKYAAWASDRMEKYPATWKVGFDESLHRDGSYYYFTQCPICTFLQREGLGKILEPLCAAEALMFKMQHGVLHREHSLIRGDSMSDYWITGDKCKDPK